MSKNTYIHASKCATLIGLLAAVGWAEPATQPSQLPEMVTVRKGDIPLTVTADAWFEPITATQIRFRPRAFSGEMKIESIAAHGTAVKAGDPLLRINTDEINRQIAMAENDLAVAAANLAKAEADLRLGNEADALAAKVQQENTTAAENAVAWWEKTDAPNMQSQYEMQLRGAKHGVEDQQDELDQLKKMYKSEELTNQTADIVVKRALRQLEFSQIGLEMTKKRVEKQKATDFEQSKRAVLNAREQQKQAAEALAAAQAQALVQRQAGLVSARAAHENAYRKLNDLRSDAAGMIVSASTDGIMLHGKLVNGTWQGTAQQTIDSGDKVAPEQVVATVVEPGKVSLIAAVPEDQVGRVRAGDSVVIIPRSQPERVLTGVAGAASPVATMPGDPAKFSVPVEIEAGADAFLPGHRAAVEIDVADARDVLVIPRTAVSNGKVRVEVGGEMSTRSVIVGRSDGKLIEVARGLKEGEVVLRTFKEE